MTLAAQLTLSSPLNALIWVFGVAGGVSIALTAASGTLAWNHRRQRSRLISRIGASETVKNYRNILTGGDLVMDDRLRLSAIQMAQALREEVRQRRSPQPPEPPPYTLGGL